MVKIMHISNLDLKTSYPLRLTIDETCHELRISKSNFYKKQRKKIKGYPIIRKDGYRSFVNTSEVISWIADCPVWWQK